MAFEDFEPIFGEPKVEWAAHSSCRLHPFLFHAHAPDSSRLVIQVTDFHSDTWEAHLSVSRLEDIRDIIGIGGSWSEFADYFISSLKSEDLKLVLEANSNSDGVSYAKLVAQKSKGMPLITIPLTKLMDSTASEVMSNLSLRLFKAFKNIKCSVIEEQERSIRLTSMIAAEQGRSETMQQQLEQRQKFQKISDSEKAGVSTSGLQNSPDKQAARDTGSTKVKNRVVPAHRRTINEESMWRKKLLEIHLGKGSSRVFFTRPCEQRDRSKNFKKAPQILIGPHLFRAFGSTSFFT